MGRVENGVNSIQHVVYPTIEAVNEAILQAQSVFGRINIPFNSICDNSFQLRNLLQLFIKTIQLAECVYGVPIARPATQAVKPLVDLLTLVKTQTNIFATVIGSFAIGERRPLGMAHQPNLDRYLGRVKKVCASIQDAEICAQLLVNVHVVARNIFRTTVAVSYKGYFVAFSFLAGVGALRAASGMTQTIRVLYFDVEKRSDVRTWLGLVIDVNMLAITVILWNMPAIKAACFIAVYGSSIAKFVIEEQRNGARATRSCCSPCMAQST